ncbi:diacylglycerol/lipid kinase family protein [Alteriqipengyuania lutimaris]|uniref:DAGKc domain-containing protein n=1 Tax=Alteriqipengyuania lutimaris TaxID=1538146 RepID=A0A395LII3_9SPHN|nr:diacylglycerol kinase family protein [Alteriqipengyuania lutimaris]MBB3034307.1 hypothetical protein [Alteriqipengyuania lutimaris]RDS76786.1 hypothetical protein DL238_03625 [Alteriqipengyuania lutimaris]
MTDKGDIWLITNAGSGSVHEELLATLHETCARAELCIAEHTEFPSDDLPKPEEIARRGIETVLVLGGDGTINAAISALQGWEGAILPLPGGTQNLLTKRLHGDAEVDAVVQAFARGQASRRRPKILRSSKGLALAGLLIGPGTSWNAVREAMRDGDAGAMLSAAGTALDGTTNKPPVRIADPEAGDRDGYPILELVPHAEGMDIAAYHARNGADFVAQTWALLRQEFRDGPHETYGPFDRVVLASTGEEPLDLLLDGEPAHGDARETVTLETCPVDLIATDPGDDA